MLSLLSETCPAWVEVAARDLDALLSDHAHCELKAAHNALSLAGRFGGEQAHMVAPLVALAEEETAHFAAVHQRLVVRGAALARPGSDRYVVALRGAAHHLPSVPALLDRLTVAALIEARSCERFLRLSEGLPCARLRSFYRELMGSEARHYRLFSGFAEQIFGVEVARQRRRQLAELEAQIVERSPLTPTVHG
ncbi:MAG: tRNA isopentenyl-2-thiomethyl-A-37 hydroxylase MiaE [Polyangiales bacterium]